MRKTIDFQSLACLEATIYLKLADISLQEITSRFGLFVIRECSVKLEIWKCFFFGKRE